VRVGVRRVDLDRPTQELHPCRRSRGSALGDQPTHVGQGFGVVGIELTHLLVADDGLLRIHAEQLTGFSQLHGDLVTRQATRDRLAGQALAGAAGD
jgi:hypothetical protein